MRTSILAYLRCPACASSTLTVSPSAEDALEITEGTVLCEDCGHVIEVAKGVLDAKHPHAAEIALREADGNARFIEATSPEYLHDDDWLLRLPYSLYHVPPQKGGDMVANFDSLVRELGWGPGSRVVELGAGNCWCAWRIAATGAEMVATDISRVKYHGLESGRTMIEGHGPYFERVVSEMERLPFADQSFDGLLIYAALHHSNDMPATLREAHRVLRPGGAALVIHEGVSGILRNNRFIGLRSVHEIDWQQFNWNEQTFWLHQYAGSARRAGLRTQLLIAPFIENRLERGDFGGLLFGRIGRLAARLWRLPGGHRLLRSQASIWAASYLVGMPLTAIFRRPQ